MYEVRQSSIKNEGENPTRVMQLGPTSMRQRLHEMFESIYFLNRKS